MWRWDRERLREFLRTLFSCDGTIYSLSDSRRPRIEFTVASEGLARDVQHALVRFGIVAKLWRKTERSWRVEITESRSAAEYQEKIGWLGEKSRRPFNVMPERHSNSGHLPNPVWDLVHTEADRAGLSLSEPARRGGEPVNAGCNPHTSRGLTQRRVATYAEVLDHDGLRLLGNDDLYWDEIASVEPIGEHQV